jgi:hypothetical protein
MSLPLTKLLFILTTIFAIGEISAQRKSETVEDKAIAQLKYLNAHPQKVSLDRTKILDYFKKECTMIVHFPFTSTDAKRGTTIHLDSLLSPHKTLIDQFIEKYRKTRIDDIPELKNEPYHAIYIRIKEMSRVSFDKRDKLAFQEIFATINKLPSSKQKVILQLQFGLLNIRNQSYYGDVTASCEQAEVYAGQIANLYERAQAYSYIGTFASGQQINDFAIRMFYLANECFENCAKDRKVKLSEQGNVLKKIGYIFVQTDLEQAQKKRLFYFANSFEKFRSAGNIKESALAAVALVSFNSHYWGMFGQYSDDKYSKDLYDRQLEALKIWFTILSNREENRQDFELDNESLYFALYSVAVNVSESDPIIGLLYHLRSLDFAARGLNTSVLFGALQNISFAYSKVRYDYFALKYADLQLYVAEKLNDQFQIKNALLHKAQIFYEIKMYDSAELYVNHIIFDPNLSINFYPTFANQLIEMAVGIKFMCLDALKLHADSARIYQQAYATYQVTHLEDLVNLIEIESKSVDEWLNRSNKRVLKVKDQLLTSTEQNLKLLRRDNYLLDSISSITLAFERKSTKQAKQQVKLEQDRRKADSLSSARQKELDAQTINLKESQNMIISVVLILVVLAAITFFVIRNKITKANIIKHKAEVNRVNELARNKVHNIENDYSEIGNFLADNQFEQLKIYNASYEGFLAVFLENWKKELVSLKDELVATERYLAVKAVLRSSINFKLDNNIAEPEKVLFIQSVFDTLLDNSVRHGFKGKEGELKFSISIRREDSFLRCQVIDNGIPPEDDADYLADEDSGLNILKSRIVNFYITRGVKLPPEFLEIKSLPYKDGTIVKIQIPYAEI